MLTSLFIFSVIALNFGFWGDSFQNTLCNVHVFGISDFIKCDKMKSDLTFKAGSNMQLSLDKTTSTITINAQTQKQENTAQIVSAGGTSLFKARNNATENAIKGLTTTKGITITDNTNDIQIDTNFLSVSKTCSVGQFVNAYDSSTGLYTCATSTKRGGDMVASWDSSSTDTTLDTTFADIFTGTSSNGKGILIDTDTYTHVRLQIEWNKIGTGTQTVQVVDIANAGNVLITLTVDSGSNDSGWVSIPSGLLNAEKNYKLQAKSTVSSDDYVFENGVVWLK